MPRTYSQFGATELDINKRCDEDTMRKFRDRDDANADGPLLIGRDNSGDKPLAGPNIDLNNYAGGVYYPYRYHYSPGLVRGTAAGDKIWHVFIPPDANILQGTILVWSRTGSAASGEITIDLLDFPGMTSHLHTTTWAGITASTAATAIKVLITFPNLRSIAPSVVNQSDDTAPLIDIELKDTTSGSDLSVIRFPPGAFSWRAA